jgi:hypothetical protein
LRRFGGVSEAHRAEREPTAEILSAAKDLSQLTANGFGGASRDRTDDLIVANDALSQLSYSPLLGRFWFCEIYFISFPINDSLRACKNNLTNAPFARLTLH